MRIARKLFLTFCLIFALSGSSFSAILGQTSYENGSSPFSLFPYVTDGITIVSDSTAPNGTKSAQYYFHSNYTAGTAPGTSSLTFSSQNELYVQFYIKYSSNWVDEPLTNKWVYFSTGAQTNADVNFTVMGHSQYGNGVWFSTQHPTNSSLNQSNKNNTFLFTYGVWHKVVIRAKQNSVGGAYDGIIQVWIDDILRLNRTDILFKREGQSTAFTKFSMIPIYGGGIQTGNPDQYMWFDYVIVQTTPFGQASDQTPPFVDTFSPADGSTGVSQATTSVSWHFKDTGDGAASTTHTVSCPAKSISKTCGDANFSCTGTSADYTVTLSGLTFSYDEAVSCVLDGSDLASTPNAAAQYTYNFTIEASPNPALAVSNTSLPSGTVGTSYSAATLEATGGVSPYTWDTSAGTVPPGLTVPASGSGNWGVPTTAGQYTATYRATDSAAATATKSLTVTIEPAIPGGTSQNTAFSDTYIGGESDTNWSTSTVLRVYQWPYGTVANRTLISDTDDITAIPSGKTITGGTLRLYLTSWEGSGGTNPMRVHCYSSTSFDTTTITWNSYIASPPTLTELGSTDVGLTPGWYEWDVTTAVAAAYAAQTPLYIALDGGSEGAADTNRIFASVDHADPTLHPQLVITYTSPVNNTAPNAPTGHYVESGDTQVTLHPGTSTGALFYTCYHTSDGSAPTTNDTSIVGVSDGQTLTGLTNGTTYKFVFTASNVYGESVISTVDTVVTEAPPGQVPSAPTGGSVTALSQAIRIYPGSSTGAATYNAYRTADGSTPSKTNYATKTTGATEGQLITGLTNGTTYKFVFTAVNVTGESAESSVVSATPAAAQVNFLIDQGNLIIIVPVGLLKNYLTQ